MKANGGKARDLGSWKRPQCPHWQHSRLTKAPNSVILRTRGYGHHHCYSLHELPCGRMPGPRPHRCPTVWSGLCPVEPICASWEAGGRLSPTVKTKKIPRLRGHGLFGKTLPFFSRERSLVLLRTASQRHLRLGQPSPCDPGRTCYPIWTEVLYNVKPGVELASLQMCLPNISTPAIVISGTRI